MDLLKESPTSHRKNLPSARWLARREATAEQTVFILGAQLPWDATLKFGNKL